MDPKEVDILMGTFTKSFGSVGGYICASKEVVAHVRASSYAMYYDSAMPAACAEQALRALLVCMGADGTDGGQQKAWLHTRGTVWFALTHARR